MTDLLFASMPYCGSSAIVPILEQVLPRYVRVLDYGPERTLDADKEIGPYFHWTHDGPERFITRLAKREMRAVYMHRDPRDCVVSMAYDMIHQGKLRESGKQEFFRGAVSGPAFYLHNITAALDWLKQPFGFPITSIGFGMVKANPLHAASLAFLHYRITDDCDEALRLSAEQNSFEAMTGRARGSDGPIHRHRFMARKGVEGEWRTEFDDETKACWEKYASAHLGRIGYA